MCEFEIYPSNLRRHKKNQKVFEFQECGLFAKIVMQATGKVKRMSCLLLLNSIKLELLVF